MMRNSNLYNVHHWEWLEELKYGFNVMLYGMGSKIEIINEFLTQEIKPHHSCLIIKGYMPNINIKLVIDILIQGLNISTKKLNPNLSLSESLVNYLKHRKEFKTRSIIIAIHSLDAIKEASEIMKFFLKLIKLGNFHIICTVDKLYSGVVWSETLDGLNGFNWIRHATPTIRSFYTELNPLNHGAEYNKIVEPLENMMTQYKYMLENGYESNEDKSDNKENNINQHKNNEDFENFVKLDAMSKQTRKSKTSTSLAHVYSSLTANAKKIFEILATIECYLPNYHETNPTNAYKNAQKVIPFHDLFKVCREEFLVGNETALRTHLREFLDHNIITLKSDEDGTEIIHLEIQNSVLQNFIQEIK